MKLKPGVKSVGIKPETALGMAIADGVYKSYANVEMTITSILDGVHGANSLHYKGLAFDARTKNLIGVNRHSLATLLRVALGDEWDVVYENDGEANEHMHLELDTK